MKSTLILSSFLFCVNQASAVGPGIDSVQMQRLIESSQQQLKVAKELLEQSRHDASKLQQATTLLEQMSKGIDQQIKPFQGTTTYDQALLKIQSENSGSLNVSASPIAGETEEQAGQRENLYRFHQQSHRADQEDLASSEKLAEALAKAPPGFVPKIQAQATIDQWQTNLRISAKLSELLASNERLRRDLKSQRREGAPEGFNLFMSGAAQQSKKVQQGVNRVP